MGRVTFAKVTSNYGTMLINIEAVGGVTTSTDNRVKILNLDGSQSLVMFLGKDAAEATRVLKSCVDEIQAAADEHNAALPSDGVL